MEFPYPIKLGYLFTKPAFSTFCPVDFLDIEGDPILEGRSILNSRSPSAYFTCPFKDSRNNHKNKMNVAALKLVKKNKEDVFRFIDKYILTLKTKGVFDSNCVSIAQLYRLAYALYKAPNYYLNEAISKGSSYPEVSSSIAVISRISHGLMHMIINLIVDKPGSLHKHMTAKEIYTYADKRNLLIGTKEVCAGSPGMINQYIDYIYTATEKKSDIKIMEENILYGNIDGYAGLSFLMEITTLIYEVVRCKSWRWRNEIGEDIHSDSFLLPIDHEEPISRHSIPHGRVASEISMLKDPFNSIKYESLYLLIWSDKKSKVSALIDEQLLLAKKTISLYEKDDVRGLIAQWRKFENVTLAIITEINSNIKDFFTDSEVFCKPEEVDLYVFFGKSPFQKLNMKGYE